MTARGELVLRRDGAQFEIISNGVFLMDTRDGRSERLLASAALAGRQAETRVLLGGLGVGFTLAEVLRHEHVTGVGVVEIEPAIVDWQRSHLGRFSGDGCDDPRVRLVCADLVGWLPSQEPRGYDVVCLDVDNGPQWTVMPANAVLYTDAGIAALRRVLRPGGVLAVWSAAADPEFEGRLRDAFDGGVQVRTVAVPRGEPDVVYLAART